MINRRGTRFPWSREYRVMGIPKTLSCPDEPASDMLDEAARKYPKRGLVQLGLTVTYPEVLEASCRLATALAGFGLEKGDRVATLLPTCIQYVVTDFALSRIGLVHVPCSSLEPVKHLTHKFQESTPKVLITIDENLADARKLARKCKVEHIVVTQLGDYSSAPLSGETLTSPHCSEYWFLDLIKNTPNNPPKVEIDPDEDLEMILFTGGTTGLPKGCMLTHKNVVANSIQNSWAFGRTNSILRGAISVLNGLPLFHSYGHMVMHTMVREGFTQILIPDARDTASMVSLIKTHYPLLQMGVPAQFMKMADGELDDIFVLGLSGSAPLPPSAQKAFEKQSGGAVMEGYGLSEMSPCTHLNASLLLRVVGGRFVQRMLTLGLMIPGSAFLINRLLRLLGPKALGFLVTRGIGMLLKFTSGSADKGKSSEKRGTIGIPLPGTEVRIVDMASGDIVADSANFPSGIRGEMLLRGPQRMKGYWPEAGTGIDEEGFIHTGDVVTVDEDGYFAIVDRTKDMINVSGYKVYSREVDDILYGHPAIEHAATVGIPDQERDGSERVIICVQPKSEYKDRVTPDEFVEFLKARVAKYAVPKSIFFVDEMPLTDVQKLDKKRVRQMALELQDDSAVATP